MANVSAATSNSTCIQFNHDVAVISVLSSLGALILLSNAFTCVVFLSTRKLAAEKTNKFLVSLALSDIIMATLIVPGYGSLCTKCSFLSQDIKRGTCFFLDGLKDFGFLANTFNVLAVTFDRYCAIIHPLRYKQNMTSHRIIIVLIVAWVAPFPLAFVKQVANLASNGKFFSNESTGKEIYSYDTSLMIFCILLPMFLLTVSNIRIVTAIRKQSSRTEDLFPEGNNFFVNNTTQVRKKVDCHREKKGTMCCLVIVLIFITCWIPRILWNIFKAFKMNEALDLKMLDKVSLVVVLVQSLANPLVYSFYRSEFRQAATKFLKLNFHCLKVPRF